MKKTLFIFGIFLFALSFATAMGDSGQIKVVGQFEQPEVSIIVPDQINLPIVANGYSTKNSFEITNEGNMEIGVSFGLEEVREGGGYHEVFDLLKVGYFEESLVPFSEEEFFIRKPQLVQGQFVELFDMGLNLSEYTLINYSETEEVYLIVTAYPA